MKVRHQVRSARESFCNCRLLSPPGPLKRTRLMRGQCRRGRRRRRPRRRPPQAPLRLPRPATTMEKALPPPPQRQSDVLDKSGGVLTQRAPSLQMQPLPDADEGAAAQRLPQRRPKPRRNRSRSQSRSRGLLVRLPGAMPVAAAASLAAAAAAVRTAAVAAGHRLPTAIRIRVED